MAAAPVLPQMFMTRPGKLPPDAETFPTPRSICRVLPSCPTKTSTCSLTCSTEKSIWSSSSFWTVSAFRDRKVLNFPFLMGQGVWLDSEKLGPNDEIAEVLKHGTLTIGFIGLAETLTALIGQHHGQSEYAQNLGLEIIGHMRARMDAESEKRKLNFSLIATPAEGLSGRFVKIDRERFGVIPGVTDRDYYTNSFHIPVYFDINAFDKIRLEAPYHALTNGGHITYVELDGDPLQNVDAFEQLIRCMKESGIGYGSINHPVDRDPVCGYTGIIGDECPHCHRKETADQPIERIRRITGYLSVRSSILTMQNARRNATE